MAHTLFLSIRSSSFSLLIHQNHNKNPKYRIKMCIMNIIATHMMPTKCIICVSLNDIGNREDSGWKSLKLFFRHDFFSYEPSVFLIAAGLCNHCAAITGPEPYGLLLLLKGKIQCWPQPMGFHGYRGQLWKIIQNIRLAKKAKRYGFFFHCDGNACRQHMNENGNRNRPHVVGSYVSRSIAHFGV